MIKHYTINITKELLIMVFEFYLTVEKACQPDKQDFKYTGLEECNLVIVVQAFKARNQLCKGAHLSNMVHETFAKLFHKRVFRSAFHGASLQKKEKIRLKSVQLQATFWQSEDFENIIDISLHILTSVIKIRSILLIGNLGDILYCVG